MELKDLLNLQDAQGFLIFTTANDDTVNGALISHGFSVDIEASDRKNETWWMYRSDGRYKAHFRYHPKRKDTPIGPPDSKEHHFITRIDFFVSGPTRAVYDVALLLLKKGAVVAAPVTEGKVITGWKTLKLDTTVEGTVN